jgi:hypothetical protein
MATPEINEVTEKALRKGGILAKLYLDMHSEKQDELQPLLADLINNKILKAPGVIYCYANIDEPIKVRDLYATNAVATVLFNDLGALVNLVFNFSPVGIEILRPEGDYVIKSRDLNSIMVSLSMISAEYSKYILTKVMKEDDLEKINRDLEIRKEMMERAIKGSGSPGEAPKEEPLKD